MGKKQIQQAEMEPLAAELSVARGNLVEANQAWVMARHRAQEDHLQDMEDHLQEWVVHHRVLVLQGKKEEA